MTWALVPSTPAQAAAIGFGSAHRPLEPVAICGDLTLVSDGAEEILPLGPGQGAIIGTLFRKHGDTGPLATIAQEDADRIVATAGQHLLDAFWGRYVAVLALPSGGTRVLRDPSGGLPAYWTSTAGQTTVASDARTLLMASGQRPDIDWTALVRILVDDQLPPRICALRDIRQVLAGMAIDIAGSCPGERICWSPWIFADAAAQSLPRSIHVDRLRDSLARVLQGWGACYARPLVGLSGGLDSSIVAAGLVAGLGRPTCVTLTTQDLVGDERIYARNLCTHLGIPLIERHYDAGHVDLDRAVAADLPVPTGRIHEQSYNRAIAEVTAEAGADAFVTGAGGDNVFYLTHSVRPVLDCLLTRGPSATALATLSAVCTITGASAAQILGAVVGLAWRSSVSAWPQVRTLVAQDALMASASGSSDHPWLENAMHVLPGKRAHVMLLLRALAHAEHRDKSLPVPMINPLLSQPLIETCLAIPTWEQVAGGRNRSVAREAAAPWLPAAIVARQTKGGPEGFVAQVIDDRRAAIAERLLEGSHARHGLVDRPMLERVLRAPVVDPQYHPRLMALLDTEAWVRHWAQAPAVPAD